MNHFSVIHEHFVSERNCSILARMFPNEVWPLAMMLRAKNDEELKAIAEEQERRHLRTLVVKGTSYYE